MKSKRGSQRSFLMDFKLFPCLYLSLRLGPFIQYNLTMMDAVEDGF